MDSQIIIPILGFAAFIVTLTAHEFSHALGGFLLGDETAKRYGRLTLNPLAHIDPIGTILIPLIGTLGGIPLIGWAKPVPFNPYNLKHGKWGAVIVSLAGPFANLVVATLAMLLTLLVTGPMGLMPDNLLVIFLSYLVMVSLALAVFNLLPVPPLDGSRLLHVILASPKHRNLLIFLETRGPLILLLAIFLDFSTGGHVLGAIFGTVFSAFFWLFGVR